MGKPDDLDELQEKPVCGCYKAKEQHQETADPGGDRNAPERSLEN